MAQTDKSTHAGSTIVVNRIKGTGTEPKYMHWGTGTTTAAVTQTALVTPRGESRVSGTSSIVTVSQTDDAYQVVGTITCASSAAAITEFGQFDASTDGNMLIRSSFDAINVEIGDSIQFTSKFKIAAS